ncbi:hypothetical protein LINPERPRIM_LOCUS31585 [Linum perenne]
MLVTGWAFSTKAKTNKSLSLPLQATPKSFPRTPQTTTTPKSKPIKQAPPCSAQSTVHYIRHLCVLLWAISGSGFPTSCPTPGSTSSTTSLPPTPIPPFLTHFLLRLLKLLPPARVSLFDVRSRLALALPQDQIPAPAPSRVLDLRCSGWWFNFRD